MIASKSTRHRIWLSTPSPFTAFAWAGAVALADGRRALPLIPARGGQLIEADLEEAVGHGAMSERHALLSPVSGHTRHRVGLRRSKRIRQRSSRPVLDLHCSQSPMSSRPACRDGAVIPDLGISVAFERNCEMNRNA